MVPFALPLLVTIHRWNSSFRIDPRSSLRVASSYLKSWMTVLRSWSMISSMTSLSGEQMFTFFAGSYTTGPINMPSKFWERWYRLSKKGLRSWSMRLFCRSLEARHHITKESWGKSAWESSSAIAFVLIEFRSFDMAMLEFHNGKERDMDDWRQLFISADPNYHILGVTQPAGSRLGFIEVGWRTAET